MFKPSICLVFLSLGLGTTGAIKSIYNSIVYNAYGYAYSSTDACVYDGTYLSAYLYSQESKFQTTGRAGTKSTESFDGLDVSISTASCAGTTVTVTEGYTSLNTYYGDNVVFEIDTNKLTSASLNNVQVPVYSYSCEYECMDICYPDIFDYGTCPEDELPYEDCYFVICEEPLYLGVANVDVTWTGLNPKSPPVSSKDTYVYRSKNYSTKYSSKGTGREASVTFAVVWDSSNVFNVLPPGDGGLGKSTYMSIDRYRAQV